MSVEGPGGELAQKLEHDTTTTLPIFFFSLKNASLCASGR